MSKVMDMIDSLVDYEKCPTAQTNCLIKDNRIKIECSICWSKQPLAEIEAKFKELANGNPCTIS